MAKQDRTTPRRKPSVTQHPLFPVTVALWFGALFGLGSLAIRASLLEGAVLATGIDTILPAAAPPLGVTARIVLALALGVMGALIGGYAARFLARSSAEQAPRNRTVTGEVKLRNRDAHPDAPARRPISALEELGDDQIDIAAQTAAPAPTGRRRALTLQEDHSGNHFHDHAPLPGGPPQVLDLAAVRVVTAFDEFDDADEDEVPALDLGSFAAVQEFIAPLADVAEVEAEFTPLTAEDTPPPRFERLGTVPMFKPAARLQFTDPYLTPEVEAQETTVETTPPTAAERIANAPLDDLGMVELAERLGRAMLRRRQLAADTAPIILPRFSGVSLDEATAVTTAMQSDFDPFAGETESPFAALAPKTAIGEIPVPLRPLSFGAISADDEDEALPDVLESLLPPRRIKVPALPIPPVDELDEPEAEEMSATDAYPSLLDVSRPAALRQQFVRIVEPDAQSDEVEPVVIFPGQGSRQAASSFAVEEAADSPFIEAPAAPALRRFDAPTGAVPGTIRPISGAPPSPVMNDPEETERALRSALATLQRMSGAA